MKTKEQILEQIEFYKNGIKGLQDEDALRNTPIWTSTIKMCNRLIQELEWVLSDEDKEG